MTRRKEAGEQSVGVSRRFIEDEDYTPWVVVEENIDFFRFLAGDLYRKYEHHFMEGVTVDDVLNNIIVYVFEKDVWSKWDWGKGYGLLNYIHYYISKQVHRVLRGLFKYILPKNFNMQDYISYCQGKKFTSTAKGSTGKNVEVTPMNVVSGDKEIGEDFTIFDLLNNSEVEDLDNREWVQWFNDFVFYVRGVSYLTDREKVIVLGRLGVDIETGAFTGEPIWFTTMGYHYAISGERARQIYAAAVVAIKDNFDVEEFFGA